VPVIVRILRVLRRRARREPFFEHGRFDGTETHHCRNSKIYLLEGVLDHARAN